MEELRCLVDLPGLRVSRDEANGWLYNQWLGEHDEASVKYYAASICACLTARPCTKILSDHSGLVGNWQGASPWVGREYFDRLAQQGILYFAWVYNLGYYDRVAMEKTLFYTRRSSPMWLRPTTGCVAARPSRGSPACEPGQ
jgi:hypothetical protein